MTNGPSQPAVVMQESNEELRCEKCGKEIDRNCQVVFILKDGTRVSEACFVTWMEKVEQKNRDWSD